MTARRRSSTKPKPIPDEEIGSTYFKHLLFGKRFKFVYPATLGFGREDWTYVKTGHNTYRNPLSPPGKKYEHRTDKNALVKRVD